MGVNTKVINPTTQDHSFGTVPALTLARKNQSPIITLAAPINLKEGKHYGPNAGFGVQHIWAEHHLEIVAAGFASVADVPAYVQRIFNTPTNLYFEDRPPKKGRIQKTRVNAVRIVTGTVILEYVQEQVNNVLTPHWSVVTAYSDTRTAGVLVGSM